MLAKILVWCSRLIIPTLGIFAIVFGVYLTSVNGTGLYSSRQVTETQSISGGTRSELVVPGKTLWDWLTVAGIPLALVAIGFILNESVRVTAESAAQRKEATDRELSVEMSRDTVLRDFTDQLSHLIINGNLTTSSSGNGASKVARSRVLLALQQLEAGAEWAKSATAKTNNQMRKGAVLRFLHEGGLINSAHPVVDLSDANFASIFLPDGAKLVDANLSGANFTASELNHVDLTGVTATSVNFSRSSMQGAIFRDGHQSGHLSQVNFSDTDLKDAVFCNADLSHALFDDATLRHADFSGANLQGAKLLKVKSLRDAIFKRANLSESEVSQSDLATAILDEHTTMPNGRKWTP